MALGGDGPVTQVSDLIHKRLTRALSIPRHPLRLPMRIRSSCTIYPPFGPPPASNRLSSDLSIHRPFPSPSLAHSFLSTGVGRTGITEACCVVEAQLKLPLMQPSVYSPQ